MGFKGMSWLPALLVFVALPVNSAVTPELQHTVREATFEVVMKKPEKDLVTYEKPLPLDLLPFQERNDAYRSIGTAFALGHNRYVTAAHVIIAGVNSQHGAPALRRSDGTVSTIERILKFSLAEDFVVFSLHDDPGRGELAVNRNPAIDEAVLAVGNALGEGIVIRDGLFNSETPEDKDGRWKWIRFSAAASPGNSGGPLLDGTGRVIGIVIGKSPNENLNYALPIGRVLDAEDLKASFDQRVLLQLPYLHGTYIFNYKDQFRLPLTWPQFVSAFREVIDRHIETGRAELLKTYAGELFPRGLGIDDFIFEREGNDDRPRLIVQEADGRWVARSPNFKTIELGGDGSVSTAGEAGVTLLRLVRSNQATDDAFYKDSKVFMDLALKALDLRRTVGQDKVRVISLGAAQTDGQFVDAYGRKWQARNYAVPFLDAYVVALSLPTPDGYAGIIAFGPSQTLTEIESQSRLLAGQFDVSYRGTLAQWRASLQRRDWLPSPLVSAKLEQGNVWALRTSRLAVGVPRDVLTLTDKSPLRLTMGFMRDGAKVVWDVQKVWWNQDDREDKAAGVWRRARPPLDAKLEFRNLFANMDERRSPYDGVLVRDTPDTFSVTDIKRAPGKNSGSFSSDLLYGVTVRLTGHPTPSEAAQASTSMLAALQILEPGIGSDVTAKVPSVAQPAAQPVTPPADPRALSDIRGRTYPQDLKDFLAASKEEASSMPQPSDAGEAQAALQQQRLRFLDAYWHLYPALTTNREVWPEFLARNHRSISTPHTISVTSAETALLDALRSPMPHREWEDLGRKLLRAYIDERKALVREQQSVPDGFRVRVAACPAPAAETSGRKSPKINRSPRSAEDFWLLDSKRRGEEGMVMVALKISASGCAIGAAITASSGFDALDRAVMEFYETLEFLPGEENGKAIESVVTLPVNFHLVE